MTPDPKPAKRTVDPAVFTLFHEQGWNCVACTNTGTPIEAHHLVSRAQGGDDVMANLIPLCRSCHARFHNGVRATRANVARYLRSDAAEDHQAYLIHKRGAFGAENYVLRLEGKVEL